MSNLCSVELSKSYLLLNHGPVTIITSAHGDKRNIMSAAWAMAVDFSPPKVAVVIDANTYTRELVEASGEFALQIPKKKIAQTVMDVGGVCGRELDKFAHFNLPTFPAQKIAAPLLQDCIAWLECKVIKQESEKYDLILAEVIAAQADANQFIDNRWQFSDEEDERSIHYMAAGEFYVTGSKFVIPS